MMKRFFLVTLFLMLSSDLVFSETAQWKSHVKEAEHLVSQGQFEKAISYLSEQTKRNNANDEDKLADAMYAVICMFEYGDPKQALFIIKPVYEQFVKKYGVKSSMSHLTRRFLIQAYVKRAEYDEAQRCAELSVQCVKTNEELAEAYLSLGSVYHGKKESIQAIETYLKAETFYKKINNSGEYNDDIGIIYNNMAAAYEAMGNYQRALASYKASLKMIPKNTESYYTTLYNLSVLYRKTGQVEKAKKGFIEAAEFYLKTEGENSHEYIMLQTDLGVLEDDYGHYDEAIKHYQIVLNYGERLGRDEKKALALKNMGSIYTSQGRLPLATSYLEKALAIYQQLPISPDLADNYEGLAVLASKANSFNKEITYNDKALEIYRALHQENQPNYANVLANKGMAYQKLKQLDRAHELYTHAFEILEKVEPKGQKMGLLYKNWGTLFIHQQQYKKAESMLQKAIILLKERLGEKHPDVASAYNNLAYLYGLQHENKKEVSYYEKAVEIAEATKGPNHASTKLYRGNLWKAKIVRRFSKSRAHHE